MSGGVDSSVAAALLKEQGYQVTGVFMCLGSAGWGEGEGSPEDRPTGGCCSPQDAADARRVADQLGIDLFVLNLQQEFEPIIRQFASEYAAGRTPNPCILCNSRIKFGRLLHQADMLGVRYVATGHYARIVPSAGASAEARAESAEDVCIARGMAKGKDQSYALFDISRASLMRILLPLGSFESKKLIRDKALELHLPVHDKPDSQEICFVPDDDYSTLLARLAPEALTPGNVVDSAGKILGRHNGYARYTIGQRKGLGIAGPEPMYVTRIDPATATVTLGPKAEVVTSVLHASGANWQVNVPEEFRATVQIRYNHSGVPGVVHMTDKKSFHVQFDQPVIAVTPGQAVVVYHEDRMLGGGWID